MQTLMDRMDALIKVARERANEGRGINEFDKLYHALRGMSSNEEETMEMMRKWNELHKEISLNNWDEQFLKAVAGEENNPDNLFYKSPNLYGFGSNIQLTQSTQEHLTKEALVKAFLEMQKEKEKAELEKEIQKAKLENVKIEARACR